ncbi:MAG: phosphopentomutase [bacterium]
MKIEKIVLIILDGVGVGEMPDADKYNDEGSATFQNTYKALGGLNLPNFFSLGLGKITGIDDTTKITGAYSKSKIASVGKDSTIGHWEIAGVITEKPFPLFPSGFPKELIENFERLTGRKVIGNKPASGTVIIEELGEEHIRTGALIVYTSADSVFQIAAHEDIIPLNELYKYCKIARDLCRGDYNVGRVIARPFRGSRGSFYRTDGRRDFSVPAPEGIVLDRLLNDGREVIGIGKVDDIFGGRGFTRCTHTKNNNEGMNLILKEVDRLHNGCLLIANLIDFDMKWGHRNDYVSFGRGLEEFDNFLSLLEDTLSVKDLLIITADHGNDPTTLSTDHTREYVPILVWNKSIDIAVDLEVRETMADIGQTIADILEVEKTPDGESFKEMLIV